EIEVSVGGEGVGGRGRGSGSRVEGRGLMEVTSTNPRPRRRRECLCTWRRGKEHVARARMQHAAAVGVAEHGNSAVLVTLAPSGEFLDRRRIDPPRGLPTHPYHHEGSWAVGRYVKSPWARAISLADAVALVDRVRES